MQPFQSYSYDTGGPYSQPGSAHPSPQTSDFYADSYFEDSVASLAPAAYDVDPIEAAYGPQAVSAGSPSVYGGSVDHNMVDAEVDMSQASGSSGFDVPGGGGGSSMSTYAMEPPVAAVPPRSYSYAGPSGSHANNVFASPHARRDGGGGGPMSNAFAASSRQGVTGSSSASASQDAFARLRAGNMSIAPSTSVDNANSQQHSRSFSQQDRQQSHQQQYMAHQQAQSQQQQQQQQSQQKQQQQQRSAAERVRMLASMRTASSPVLSVSPGATFQLSPARPTLARPQSHQGVSLVLDEQAQLAQAMHQPYPSYSLSNPVYDSYGSSYGTAETASTPLAAYSQQQQQSPRAPLAVDTKPFSHNPSVPSDPYNPKALGLPSPPPRTNDGAKTTHQHKNIYSGSGFDLVGILARVVNRRSPTIEIGAVDMSCSFVVVDARKFDTPIVYASETFARLTGYETDEIVGRNCRFLQAPGDQAVVQGEKRRYTDGNAAHHLRKHIERGEETQVSSINYHKGGKPFINLVTCVPVSMDDSGQVSYFVGFQVDLVDQPAAILDKMQNGSYIVNYSVVHATIGRNPSVISFDPTVSTEAAEDSAQQVAQGQVAQALPRRDPAGTTSQQAREQVRTDEPGELIASVAAQGANALVNESMKRQFMRSLVDESDDLIHVLSLKGALLYVSGASRRSLEYEPNESLGKTLSSFCHPSDIVSVQRELKDAGVAASPTVNLVYRIRRKNSGYVWFEAQGRSHLEAGKGRKCVILSGRPREVPKMSWRDLEEEGGVGAGADEFWAKVCVDGIVSSATQSAQKMLGVSDVDSASLGKGIADLSRPRSDDAERFMSASRTTSRGEPTKVSHAIVPHPGATPINVVTRFYPARSGTDNQSKENVPAAPPTMQPICGSQVTVIAQVSLASKEAVRSGRRRLSSSTVTNTASMGSTTSASVSSVPTTLDMSSTTTAASAATTASASSAGVPCPTSVVAAAVPGTGPPGSTSFSASPSTFKALTSAPSASDNVFDESNVTRGTSWQFELHQMRLTNKKSREERQALEAIMKRKEQLAKAPPPSKAGSTQRACANCGRTSSAEWRSGPTGPKTLCNACGLRWSKARSQAAQAEKKRQQAGGDVKPSAAAMAYATSSGSPSESRSGSRDSSGSGSLSTAPTTMQGSPVSSGQQQPSPQSPRSSDSIPYASPLGLAPNNVSPVPLYASMSIAPEVRPIRPPSIHQPTSKLQHGFVASSSPGPPSSSSLLPDG